MKSNRHIDRSLTVAPCALLLIALSALMCADAAAAQQPAAPENRTDQAESQASQTPSAEQSAPESAGGEADDPAGQDPDAVQEPEAPAEDPEDWDPLQDQDFEEAEKAARQAAKKAARAEACPSPDLPQKEAIDKVHKGLFKAVCATAFWFDSLFGEVRIDEEREQTFGRLLVGAKYNEPNGLEDEVNFRARLALPTVERRLSAFASRGDAEEILSDTTEAQVPSVNRSLALPEDDEWLVGLGYSRPGRHGGNTSFDLGLNLDFPVEPFVKVKYRYNYFLSDRSLVRLRQTVFWEREDGYGTTNRLDWERLLPKNRLVRVRTSLRISEIIQGVDWYGELTLFTRGQGRNAIAYQLAATGETEAEVTLGRYVGRVIYRRRLHRDWFFLDVRPGVAWARRPGDLKREFEPVLLVGTEILFGERGR